MFSWMGRTKRGLRMLFTRNIFTRNIFTNNLLTSNLFTSNIFTADALWVATQQTGRRGADAKLETIMVFLSSPALFFLSSSAIFTLIGWAYWAYLLWSVWCLLSLFVCRQGWHAVQVIALHCIDSKSLQLNYVHRGLSCQFQWNHHSFFFWK